MYDIMHNFVKVAENIFTRNGGYMKKRFSVIFIFLAFIFLIGCYSKIKIGNMYAEKFTNKTTVTEFKSKSAYLMDAQSGTVIFKLNEDRRLPIASMCKIMTLLLCFEDIDQGNTKFSDDIVVSDNAGGMGGSQIFLDKNASYKVEDLIKGIVVASANDASVAMAEHICGSEEVFVEKMNEKAQSLGMKNTVFTNCTGLPKAGQFSSAKDVAIMFSELLKHKDYFRFSNIWMDEINHPNDRITQISNTNKLIRFYEGCDSGKTGYTSEAGHCLCASAKRNGMRLISVVISSPDSKTRFNEASSLFNYGFANFTNKMIIDDKKPLDIKVEISGGKQDTIEVIAEKPFFLFSEKNQKRSVEINFVPEEKIKAPVLKGDSVGYLVIYENNIEIGRVKVISNETVECQTYFDVLYDVIKGWSLI